jgi:hypothetical protein
MACVLFLGMSSSLAVVVGATAATVRACEVWREKKPTKVDEIVLTLRKFFHGLFELVDSGASSATNGTPAAPDLYVTNTSDYSRQPQCFADANKPPSRREHLYYPIGLVVRKIGETDLRGKYWLVETEYGLKTFIKEEHLTLLQKDSVYFFAHTVKLKKHYCLGQEEKPCQPPYSGNRYLDPQSRFAVATLSDFEQSQHDLRHNYILNVNDLPCGQIKVGIYGKGLQALNNATREEFARLNTCVDMVETAPPHTLDPALKVVLWNNYVDYFTKPIKSALLRVETEYLQTLAPEFNVQKQCGQKLRFTSETEYKIEGKAALKLAILEIGGGAAKKYLQSYEETADPKVAIFLYAYDLETETREAKAVSVPIQVRYGCDEHHSAPQKAHEIRVSHPLLGKGDDFVVGIKNVDVAEDKSDILAITYEGKSGIFNQGHVFLIEGPDDYFSVRDKLYGIFSRQYHSQIQDFYEDPDDQLYHHRLTNFLTHLVIAATGKPVPKK